MAQRFRSLIVLIPICNKIWCHLLACRNTCMKSTVYIFKKKKKGHWIVIASCRLPRARVRRLSQKTRKSVAFSGRKYVISKDDNFQFQNNSPSWKLCAQ